MTRYAALLLASTILAGCPSEPGEGASTKGTTSEKAIGGDDASPQTSSDRTSVNELLTDEPIPVGSPNATGKLPYPPQIGPLPTRAAPTPEGLKAPAGKELVSFYVYGGGGAGPHLKVGGYVEVFPARPSMHAVMPAVYATRVEAVTVTDEWVSLTVAVAPDKAGVIRKIAAEVTMVRVRPATPPGKGPRSDPGVGESVADAPPKEIESSLPKSSSKR